MTPTHATLSALACIALVSSAQASHRPRLSDVPVAKSPARHPYPKPAEVSASQRDGALVLEAIGGGSAANETAVVRLRSRRGCLVIDNVSRPDESVEWPVKGVLRVDLQQIRQQGRGRVLVTQHLAADTRSLGVRLLGETRTPLLRLGSNAQLAVYAYRTSTALALVAFAPGSTLQAQNQGGGIGATSCGLMHTTIPLASTAEAMDFAAQRIIPLTAAEQEDANRGVFHQPRVVNSVAHVSLSKLGADKAPVLAALVRQERGSGGSANVDVPVPIPEAEF